ncbi:MAG TPA: glycosyltransferase [Solirubrobacteraceae bacterium]|nr:glycosyltransferase [Solirubrobacteraceae bacterium]
MRIALVSPYSWTYPGGVTRHIEALASELRDTGHEACVLAPFDPDDQLSVRLHGGARPQRRVPPADFCPLGRTVGISANGAVSNVAVTPASVHRLRAQLRGRGFDVVHLHEPVVPVIGWDALFSAGEVPLVGTFHTYSENLLTNGIAAIGLGGRRRMNRLHMRIAVSDAAAWTAARFYGGRYRVIPNGVALPAAQVEPRPRSEETKLAIVFVGQAVERKGLPVLLRAFEALREHVDATLTIVGASSEEVAHMLLDDRGVRALGKVSEERKLAELQAADVLCAPSLGGESFGMVLTEAFAAGKPVVASDIAGYRDVVRDGVDCRLVPAGDALALADALRELSLEPRRMRAMALAARERAERFAWPHVAREVADCYEQARELARMGASPARARVMRAALKRGLVPADLQPRVPPQRLPKPSSLAPAPAGRSRRARRLRRVGFAASTLAGATLAGVALQRVGVAHVVAALAASKPGLVAAGLGLMCAAMLARAVAWHSILATAPVWRRAKRRDAMQGTFIGVLMSATLPARLGEHSRALIVARRVGRARETLPVVLGTMVTQTLLNLVALAILAAVTLSRVSVLEGHARGVLVIALAPVVAVVAAALVPLALPAAAVSRSRRLQVAVAALRRGLLRLREGLRVFRRPLRAGVAAVAQLGAWALQWLACWLLLTALGLDLRSGAQAAAAVLFAVNVTAVIPATPANIGIFQVACVAVLAGAYRVSTPEAVAYGIVLQAIELLSAALMGGSALLNEGLSWRELRRRAMHASPVKLPAVPETGRGAMARGR